MDYYTLTTYYRGLLTPVKVHRSEFVKAVCIAALKKHKDLTPKLSDSTAQIVGIINLTKIRVLRKEVKLRGLVDSGTTVWLVDQAEWDSYVAALNAKEKPTRHGRSVPYQYPASLSAAQLFDFVLTYCSGKGLRAHASLQLDPKLAAALASAQRNASSRASPGTASRASPGAAVAGASYAVATDSDEMNYASSAESLKDGEDMEHFVPDDIVLNETWADHMSHTSRSSSQSMDREEDLAEKPLNDNGVANCHSDAVESTDDMAGSPLEETTTPDHDGVAKDSEGSKSNSFVPVDELGANDASTESGRDNIQSLSSQNIEVAADATEPAPEPEVAETQSLDNQPSQSENSRSDEPGRSVTGGFVEAVVSNNIHDDHDLKSNSASESVDHEMTEESNNYKGNDKVAGESVDVSIVSKVGDEATPVQADQSKTDCAHLTTGSQQSCEPAADTASETEAPEAVLRIDDNQAENSAKSDDDDFTSVSEEVEPDAATTLLATPTSSGVNVDEALLNSMKSDLHELKKHILKRRDTPWKRPKQNKIVRFGKKLLRTVKMFSGISNNSTMDMSNITDVDHSEKQQIQSPLINDSSSPSLQVNKSPRISERISIHLTGLSTDDEDAQHGMAYYAASLKLNDVNQTEPDMSMMSEDNSKAQQLDANNAVDDTLVSEIDNDLVANDATIETERIVDKTTFALLNASIDSASDIRVRSGSLSGESQSDASDSDSAFDEKGEESSEKYPAAVMFYAPFLWSSEILRLRTVLNSIDKSSEKNGTLAQQVTKEISFFESALLGTQFYVAGSVAFEFLSKKLDGSVVQRSLDRFLAGRHLDDVAGDLERFEYLANLWAAFQLYGRVDACVNSIVVETIQIHHVLKLLENLDCGFVTSRGGRAVGKFNLEWLQRQLRSLAGDKPSEFEFLIQDHSLMSAQGPNALPRETLRAREAAIKDSQFKSGLKKESWTSFSFVRFVQLFDYLCHSESFAKEIHRITSVAEAFNYAIRPPSVAMFGSDRGSALFDPLGHKHEPLSERSVQPKKVMAAISKMIQAHVNNSDLDKLYFPSQNFIARYELSSLDPSSCEDSMSLQHLRGGIIDDPEVTFGHSVLSVPYMNGAAESIHSGSAASSSVHQQSNALLCDGDLVQWRQIYARFASHLPSDTISTIKNKCLGKAGASAIKNPFMSFEDCKICLQALNLYPSSVDQSTLTRLFRAVKRWEWNLAFYYCSGAVVRDVAGSSSSSQEMGGTAQSDEGTRSSSMESDKLSGSKAASKAVKDVRVPGGVKGQRAGAAVRGAGAAAAKKSPVNPLPEALRHIVKNHVVVHEVVDGGGASTPARDQQLLHDCLITLPTFTISFWGFMELIIRLSVLTFERSVSQAPSADEPLPCGLVIDRATLRACIHNMLRLIDVRGAKHALLNNKKYSLSLPKFACK